MATGRERGRDDRAVSEVISVVLMVAVTIILAAMVGTVLLNIVSGVEKDPLAGASIKEDAESNEITVTFAATQQEGTSINVQIMDSGGTVLHDYNLNEVGDTQTNTMPSDGTYRVLVTAVADGKSAVINDVEKSV